MTLTAETQVSAQDALRVPGLAEPLALALPPEIEALRGRALELQQRGANSSPLPVPELLLSDARAWTAHTPDEDWLIWRARRCAARLQAMPVAIEPGERLVGRPRYREATAAEQPQLEAARQTLADMPPFPGGDPGHFHPDYDKLFRLGIGGILCEITALEAEHAARATSPAEASAVAFCQACRIALQGMAAYIRHAAEAYDALAASNGEGARWGELAAVCRHVANAPPRTFHEALQLMFLTQVALWFGEDHGLTCPGRMDQTLRAFYDADLAAGRITPRAAMELIACLLIQMNRILDPGSAIAVMVGGRDAQGRDVTHPLTYLVLAARLATRLVYPTVGLAWHAGTPRELVEFSVECLARGRGDPAFFNDELIVSALRDHGVSVEDSYNYMNSTCVEIKVVGRSNMWVTAPYYNLPQGLLDVLGAVARGELPAPATYAELEARVRANLAGKVAESARRLDAIWKAREQTGGFPLASCLVLDCLARGQDFDRGGARYNWVENSFVGLANLVDSLLALRHLVYERGELTLAELAGILERDFAGHEAMRQRIANTLPKYGNDQPEPDALAAEWAAFLIATTEAQQVGLHRYVPGFFCWVMHERLGSQTGATPDGRHAGWPLADGAGGAQGREKAGPTAAILSTTHWSHRAALGGLVQNCKFSGRLMQDPHSRAALRDLIETYLRRGGFEIQVNVVNRETLLDARAHPGRYADLLVRVAGYSDYFVKLNDKMQQEVIARTEHELG